MGTGLPGCRSGVLALSKKKEQWRQLAAFPRPEPRRLCWSRGPSLPFPAGRLQIGCCHGASSLHFLETAVSSEAWVLLSLAELSQGHAFHDPNPLTLK